MALIMVEGFDNIAAANLTSKGWYAAGSWSLSSAYARGGVGQGMRNNSIGNLLSHAFTGASTIVVGFAWVVISGYNGYRVCALRNDGTTHFGVGYNGTLKRLDFWTGEFATYVGSTPINTVLQDTWYYLEFKVYVHDTNGTIEARVNEVSTTIGPIDTKNGTTTTIDNFLLGTVSNDGVAWAYVDDLYILDDTGSAPWNDFLGDVRVQTLYPTAESACAWTPSTGTDNSALVDDTTSDGDSTYVYSNTPGQQDLYTMGNLSANTLSVLGVQACVMAKKDDAGTRSVKILTKSGATTDTGPAQALSSGSYVMYKEVNQADPNTSAQWAIAAVDAAELGVETV